MNRFHFSQWKTNAITSEHLKFWPNMRGAFMSSNTSHCISSNSNKLSKHNLNPNYQAAIHKCALADVRCDRLLFACEFRSEKYSESVATSNKKIKDLFIKLLNLYLMKMRYWMEANTKAKNFFLIHDFFFRFGYKKSISLHLSARYRRTTAFPPSRDISLRLCGFGFG